MIDVKTNRAARKWNRKELMARVLWAIATPFFRLSPRPFWGWRRFILRLFGARIGADARIFPTARIEMPWNLEVGAEASIGDHAILYSLGKITIGARSTVSQYAHLCAGSHDRRKPEFPLTKPPIRVGEDVWICADAFVGPGVSIGPNAIVGARAVAMKDIQEANVVTGNPARCIGVR